MDMALFHTILFLTTCEYLISTSWYNDIWFTCLNVPDLIIGTTDLINNNNVYLHQIQ